MGEVLQGEEDAYSVQISRGPLQSKVEEIFVPTDPQYLEDGPINIPVDLEFSIKTIMNRAAGDKQAFQSKIVVIKLLKKEDKESDAASNISIAAQAQFDLA